MKIIRLKKLLKNYKRLLLNNIDIKVKIIKSKSIYSNLNNLKNNNKKKKRN